MFLFLFKIIEKKQVRFLPMFWKENARFLLRFRKYLYLCIY